MDMNRARKLLSNSSVTCRGSDITKEARKKTLYSSLHNTDKLAQARSYRYWTTSVYFTWVMNTTHKSSHGSTQKAVLAAQPLRAMNESESENGQRVQV